MISRPHGCAQANHCHDVTNCVNVAGRSDNTFAMRCGQMQAGRSYRKLKAKSVDTYGALSYLKGPLVSGEPLGGLSPALVK
jgi:hypothetical protein